MKHIASGAGILRVSCHSDAVFWDDVDDLGLGGDPSLRDSSSTHCHLPGSSTPEDAGDFLSERVISKQNNSQRDVQLPITLKNYSQIPQPWKGGERLKCCACV